MKTTTLLLSALLLLTSCGTTFYKSQPSGALNLQVNNKLTADISVDTTKKLSGVATQTKILGFTTQGPEKFADGVTYGPSQGGSFLDVIFADSRDEVKAAAAYEATKGANVDVLVAPQYLIERKGFLFFYSKISVRVTGYPGVIKKIE